MADPRFYKLAQRIGHVYHDRLMHQGQDFHQGPPEVNPPNPVEEFRSTMLGPMDPREFLNEFLSEGKYYEKFFKDDICRLYEKVPPTAVYRQFIVDPLVSPLPLPRLPAAFFSCNGFSPPISSRHKIKILNHTSLFGFRPSGDIVFCDRAKLPKSKRSHMPEIIAVHERFQFVVDESKSSDKPLQIDDMGLAEYFITVQPDREDDFFHDPTPGMEHLFDPKKPTLHTHFFALNHISDPEERKKATHGLEQMIKRVVDIWSQQWRTHIFSISIAGSMARFLLWDRSGTIITRAFDIRQQPRLLEDFLTLYYRSSRATRGYDTTASWAGSVRPTPKNRPKGPEEKSEESEGSKESEVGAASSSAAT